MVLGLIRTTAAVAAKYLYAPTECISKSDILRKTSHSKFRSRSVQLCSHYVISSVVSAGGGLPKTECDILVKISDPAPHRSL